MAAVLATFQHHSAPRGLRTARTGEGARDELHGYAPEDALPQGSRPPCLGVPRGPLARVQRRTVQQIVDAVPLVPLLDDPVPQMVEQLPDVLRFFDSLLPVPEQAIEVPKIVLDDVFVRTSVRDTQLVEQLVEVPTIISYSSLRRTMEQNVDIPVPRRGGRSTGLQGFLPGQSSTASSSSSKKRISERTVEQIVRFPGEGLQDFRPGQVSPASSSFHSPAGSDDDANEPGDGVFRTFPHGKKCGVPGRSVRTCPGTSAHGPRRLMSSPGGPMSRRWEYERRMIDINQRVADDLPIGPKEYEAWRRWSGLPPSSSYSSGKRRKRKKRSKKKLSKSSSGVRIRRCVHRFRSRSSSSRCVPSLRPLVSGSLLFAVLLGSTVDTCYVSLQRLLWLSSSTWRSSLQSFIFSWTVWHVVNYAVLGTDSQAIRGLYASVQFSDKVVFLPCVGQ